MASEASTDAEKVAAAFKLSEKFYSRHPINLILAYGNYQNEFAGVSTPLPWDTIVGFPEIKQEKNVFRDTTSTTEDPTKRNVVLMGRETFLTLNCKPLPYRLNVVISKTFGNSFFPNGENANLKGFHSFEDAFAFMNSDDSIESIFVIGGYKIWMEFIDNPFFANALKALYLTKINTKEIMINYPHNPKEYEYSNHIYSKVFRRVFPLRDHRKDMVALGYLGQNVRYVWKRKVYYVFESPMLQTRGLTTSSHDEEGYLDLIRDIMRFGDYRSDRTQVGTLATFGNVLRFSLRKGVLPTITTKKMFLKGIIGELLWFIKGSTDAKELSAQGIKIWDKNSSKESLSKLGIARAEGDCGPIYGWNWRHWGAEYVDCKTNYEGQGIDQLQSVIEKLRNNPTDRRLIVSAWNPSDIPQMALPPCHMMFQFFVAKGELSCMMIQRSADMGLGVPFNITSYCLLTHMIAHVCGLQGGDFIHVMGDTHIYMNHVTALWKQLETNVGKFPTVRFTEGLKEIDDFKWEDFAVENYKPTGGPLPMEMAL